MSFNINPGTGPVDGATEAHARANMEALVADVNTDATEDQQIVLNPDVIGEDNGRFTFAVIHSNGVESEVDMPGIVLDKVRYMRLPGQSPANYPRLYVNGSSWFWAFAVDILRSRTENDD